jgi:hypothetical protein
MKIEYLVRDYKENLWNVYQRITTRGANIYADNYEPDVIEEILVFSGEISDCESYIRLHEGGYMDRNLNNTTDDISGYNTHRHLNNPVEKQLHDNFLEHINSNNINEIIFGQGSIEQLTEREMRIAVSAIQWIGSPIGRGLYNKSINLDSNNRNTCRSTFT